MNASAQHQWKLIYENDASGKAIYGELIDLIGAVQQGASIRIYYRSSGDSTFVEHTAMVKFSTILNSPKGRHVCAQIDPIIGQKPNFEEGIITLKENLEWSLIVSTTGKNDQMTRNVITGEVVNHSFRNWGTKWFVKVDD